MRSIAVIVAALAVLSVVSASSWSTRTSDAMERMKEMRDVRAALKAAAPGNGTGEVEHSMQRPEGTRHFWSYVPTTYNGTALPLVFATHGLGDDCYSFGHNTGMVAEAEKRNFILVYPCGWVGFFWVETAWNAGTCCEEGSPIDDVQFFKDMVTYMSSNFAVNPDRVYMSGFSNGAFMTETILCKASDVFRAGASVSGTTVVLPGNDEGMANCDADHAKIGAKRPLLHIHGNLDFVVPWDGDKILGFPQIPTDFERWAARNNCTGSPVQTFSNGPYTNQVYQHCADDVTIELVKHDGGVHEWPSDQYFDTATYICNYFKL